MTDGSRALDLKRVGEYAWGPALLDEFELS